MAVGDVGVLRVVGRFQDQNVVNSIHYEMTEQLSADLVIWEVMAGIWVSDISTAWLARHVVEYELIGVKMFTAKGLAKPPGYIPDGSPGIVVGDPQEAFVCRTLTLYTDEGNPHVRGRVQLSGGAESMFDDTDGSVTTAEVTALDTLALLLLDGLDNAGDVAKIVLWNATLLTTADVVAVKPRITPSVVRSRRVRQFHIG